MGIGAGIVIAAIGAILKYAVTTETSGVDIQTIGVILMIAGIVIAVVAAIATAASRRRVYDDGYGRTVIEDGPPDGARI